MQYRVSNAKSAAVAAVAALVITAILQVPTFAQERYRQRGPAAIQDSPEVSPKVIPPWERPGVGYWRLGVTTEILDVGERIRNVVPRSAAVRAGLERGDTIVAVNGFQVGRVGHLLYPLEDELQRNADTRGRVLLLVHDTRTGRLLNVDVALDLVGEPGREGFIHGEVIYRDRADVPHNAELRLSLQRRTFTGMEIIAEQVIQDIGHSPVVFDFHYPLNVIAPTERYYLVAEIWFGARQLLVSERPFEFRGDQTPTGVRLVMRRA